MSSNPYWLTVEEVVTIHDDLIREFGGSLGVLNEGALESTLSRPKQLAYYQSESTIYELAAAYGYGLSKSHCFLDGNKRTALDVIVVFFLRNGYSLNASEVEAVEVIVKVATDKLYEIELANWIASNSSSENQ